MQASSLTLLPLLDLSDAKHCLLAEPSKLNSPFLRAKQYFFN
jgi:hypothetical protein